MMDKCLDCHSTLKKGELVCFTCGAAVRDRNPKPGLAAHLALITTVGMFLCGALTIASLFEDVTPPFKTCMTATVVLILVKGSADQMLERKKS